MNMELIRNNNEFDKILGSSNLLTEQIRKAKLASQTDIPVLICGETGTGKELFAKAIHYDGVRKKGPFVAENCSAIPSNLVEGILFGTEVGGFTEAINRRGLFEKANGGTLLLDELNSMPFFLQSKLLRVLEEKTIRRVGGVNEIKLDVRIISTINEDVNQLLANGEFRIDLYYRLNAVKLVIPPLRGRTGDIDEYVEAFIREASQRYKKNIDRMSQEALNYLKGYEFPGNVRELKNMIEGIVALSMDEKEITKKMLEKSLNWNNI